MTDIMCAGIGCDRPAGTATVTIVAPPSMGADDFTLEPRCAACLLDVIRHLRPTVYLDGTPTFRIDDMDDPIDLWPADPDGWDELDPTCDPFDRDEKRRIAITLALLTAGLTAALYLFVTAR